MPRDPGGTSAGARFWGHLLDTDLVIPEDRGFTAITRRDPSAQVLVLLPEIALNAGILDHTRIAARPLDAERPTRTLALVWRRASPRERDFQLLGEVLKAAA